MTGRPVQASSCPISASAAKMPVMLLTCLLATWARWGRPCRNHNQQMCVFVRMRVYVYTHVCIYIHLCVDVYISLLTPETKLFNSSCM